MKLTDALWLAAVAVPIVGAPGRPASGITLAEAADGGPTPILFVAVTLNV